MFLKYVEIQGFKSFPDKTRIKFDRVLTGIVGPNGSGKSNISDAVRWVLGEQSTKSLRGGKMEDVIFGGTLTTRKPMGYAQVTLCLDNSDARIADTGEQILVTRRYYRSGDSEYSINGAAVRLRDLREMFMDTGLGRDGYSIIGQGKIAEVVDSRPQDRREVFEEASGIAKFRFRKTEAERKLNAAQDNLDRLRDISGMLESRIGPLAEQSEKAKRFLDLSGVRKGLEITLYTDTIRRSRENLKIQQERLEIAKLDYATAEEKMSGVDEEIAGIYEENRAEEALSASYAEAVEQRNSEINELESRAAVLRNDMMHAERDVRSLQDDLDDMSRDGGDLRDEIERRRIEAQEKRAEALVVDGDIRDTEEQIVALIEANTATDQKRSEAAARIQELSAEISAIRAELAAAESTVNALDEREQTVRTALASQQERLAQAEHELDEVKHICADLEEKKQDATNEMNGYVMKTQSRSGKLRELNEGLAQADGKIESARHKISVLNDLESSMEGFLPPVKKVIEAGQRHELGGVLGTVSSLFSVKPGMELAIETALGASMQHIVVENERSARDCLDFLKKGRIGKATVIPLDTVSPSNFRYRDRLRDAGVIGLGSDLVECDARYRKVADFLLGRIIICEDLDYASSVAKKTGFSVRIVTKDGQVINSGGTYTGGFVSRQAGSFSRRSEIDRLEKEIRELEASTASDREKRDGLEKDLTDMSDRMDQIREELVNLREDSVRATAEKERLEREISTIEESNGTGEAELSSITDMRKRKMDEIASGSTREEQLSGEMSLLESEINSGDQDDFMQRRTALMDELAAKRVRKAEIVKDAESIENSVQEMVSRGERALERAAGLEDQIKSVGIENEQRQKLMDSINVELSEKRENVDSLRNRIRECADKRADNEERIQELRNSRDSFTDERERIAGEIARLDERKNSSEAEYNNSVTKLWDEYELTPAEALPLCVEFTNVTELRSSVASVRAKIRALGSVNTAAIEEYEEVTRQYEFLSEQIADADSSRKQLLELIDKLESEMKQLFTASFNEINTRFHTTFSELFGGGRANLFLTDENDILGSGIELDVQPPGKVIKNLSALSGGEKALVAIAIYMAILEVNPSPFCILDEIDSALDESNVVRFARYLKRMTSETQMIAITHRRGTMEAADVLYGVTMQEEGVSMVLRLDIEDAEVLIAGDRNN